MCPNKSNKDWKALVSKYGEKKAMEMYVENNYEIPRTTSIDKEPVYKDSFGQRKIRSISSSQLLNKLPNVANRIIKKVKTYFSDFNVNTGLLFDENGKWVEVEPGKDNMHYRNAIISVISWANDTNTETPPREYFNEYLEMFRHIPVIKEGLDKYGEKRLVNIMSRYTDGEKVSKSFQAYEKRFWDSVRSLLGSEGITNILEKSLRDDNQTSDTEFSNTEKESAEKIVEHRLDFDGYVNMSDRKSTEAIKRLPTQAVRKELDIRFKQVFKDSDTISKEEKFKDYLLNNIDGYVNALTDIDSNMFKATLFTVKEIAQMKHKINELGSKVLWEEFSNKVKDDSYNMSEEAYYLYESYVKMKKHEFSHTQYEDNIIISDKKMINKVEIQEEVDTEIHRQNYNRQRAYNKMPAVLRPLMKKIENFAVNLIGPRLVDKFLSGGLDTTLSKVHYQSFNKAEDTRLDIINKVDDILSGNKNLLDSSLYLTGYKSINDVKTTVIPYLKRNKEGYTKESVVLTDDEMLQLYLIYRQDKPRKGYTTTPKDSLIENGFVIDSKMFKDRKGFINEVVRLSEKDIETKIVPYIKENYSDYISKVDRANDLMYNNTNTVFKIENGVDLDKVENYFPLQYASMESISFSNKNRLIDYFKGSMLRPGNESTPFNIAGASAAMEFHKKTASVYSAYSIPLRNAEKIGNKIKNSTLYKTDKEYKKYIDEYENHLTRIANSGVGLSQLQTDRDWDKWLNRVTSNYSVGILGMNFPVMMKQPVSYQTAANFIDPTYLKRAGYGVGNMVGISPKQIIQSLVNPDKKAKWYQWELFEGDEYFQEMIENSPKMAYRMKGYNSRESGEAFLESAADDMVTIPFMKDKEGKPIRISKKRLMEGIRVFDAATVTSLYKAVAIEAQDKGLTRGSDAYKRYTKARIEEVVELSQPTYDPNNRTNWSHSTSPIIRMLTMFGSARSKIGMIMIEKAFDYIMNPNKETLKALAKGSVHSMLYASIFIATINMLKTGMLYGFDEPEDKLFKPFGRDMLLTATGGFYGLGDITRIVASNLDDAPWTARIEHPLQQLITLYTDAGSGLLKGDLPKFTEKSLKALFLSKGLPNQAVSLPTTVIKERL